MLGLHGGWHGKVDILVTCKNEELLPVFIGESIDDEILETDENIVDNSLDQIMAEAIVFSFFQRKQYFGRLKHNLIPSIGIISGRLIVFMYDCENDVLLGSSVMPLLNQGGIAVSSVISLWLVLNYKLFGTGLIDELKRYQANVHRLLGDEKLEEYRTKVSMPFNNTFCQDISYDPTSFFNEDPKRKLNSYPEDQYPVKKLLKKQ
ncbi:uncharacterized protein LOC132756229 [Ruditapes philippinarum]|uniref:uncharacterized protein LOC132756229 n=1 Tax=Ruditapes philippinarum TaxID=129788 RepID=UPI00295C12D9|nr:uncharacterized protein LOC132756229 [Ruditapes philippinarum]